jgi:phosphoadenosine phosphosulfate reductase
VRGDDGQARVYDSVLTLVNQVLSPPSPEPRAAGSSQGTSPAGDTAWPAEKVRALQDELARQPPTEILRRLLGEFGARCGLAFSGAEDVVLIDMAVKSRLPFSVFCLDTGRLHPETYRFIDRVRKHYGVPIDLTFPSHLEVEDLVRRKGLFSFYEDGHHECCQIRKVAPLKRHLTGLDAWVSGQRSDQSPATRANVPVLELDPAFQGRSGQPLVKGNPLASWSLQDVWQYVPTNELHERGFVSIGCEPCTRAPRPGEHERAGRWWWEDATQRECGLHVKPASQIQRPLNTRSGER